MQWAHQSHELLGSRTSEFCAWWENIVHCDLLQLHVVAVAVAHGCDSMCHECHVVVAVACGCDSMCHVFIDSNSSRALQAIAMWLYVSGWIQIPDDAWWQHDSPDNYGDYDPWQWHFTSWDDNFDWYDEDCASSQSQSCYAAKHRKRHLPLKRQSKWQSRWYRTFPRRVRRRSYMLSKH